MNLVNFIENNLWGLVIAAISIAFQIGMRYAQLKNFVTKENLLENFHTKKEVEKRISAVFDNHCPFSSSLETLNQRVNKLEKHNEEFTMQYQEANSEIMMVLQELKFNTKRICEKLEVKYLNNL